MIDKKKIHIPTDAEDAAITAAAMTDPDNPPLTEEMLKRFKRKPGQRGKQKAPTKERTGIYLSREVLQAYRATGKGWQTRINDDLLEIVRKRG